MPVDHPSLIAALRWWFDGRLSFERPVYVIGGAVRDHLLKRNPRDIDLACEDAGFLARRLAHIHDARITRLEKDFRPVVTWRVSGRGEGGRRMELDVSSFVGGELTSDLQYRDFTLNAIAVEVFADGFLGGIVDPLGGCRDMADGVIRQAHPAAFHNDPLRILRAVRFAVVLDFGMEETTQNAVRDCRMLLTGVAPERISGELLEILNTPRSRAWFQWFQWMDEQGVLEVIFPEITPMKGCRQNAFHHLDVWGHSLAVMENCQYILGRLENFFGTEAAQVRRVLDVEHRTPLLKLAAMLHDVGKPARQAMDPETGRITFHGHDAEGALLVEAVADRLRLSNLDKTFLKQMVAEHLHVKNLSRPEVRHGTRVRWFRRMMDSCVPSIILAMADIEGSLGPATSPETRKKHLQWLTHMAKSYFQEIKPRLKRDRDFITGKDLIRLGMTPGPAMGEILKAVQQARDDGEVTTVDEAMVLVKSYLDNGTV